MESNIFMIEGVKLIAQEIKDLNKKLTKVLGTSKKEEFFRMTSQLREKKLLLQSEILVCKRKGFGREVVKFEKLLSL